jgi:hypothetical protein
MDAPQRSQEVFVSGIGRPLTGDPAGECDQEEDGGENRELLHQIARSRQLTKLCSLS